MPKGQTVTARNYSEVILKKKKKQKKKQQNCVHSTWMPKLHDIECRNECCVTDIMRIQYSLLLTSKCDLDLGATELGLVHNTCSLMMLNISLK